MYDTHRTEVDGIEATWRLHHPPRAVIIKVYNRSENVPIVAFDAGRCPDLADARARFPDLEKLWDAVRHDFWDQLTPRGWGTVTGDSPRLERK
ncbi:hypothetical protein [Nocardia terpenica]|uniref:Uncharacterized protein n=1 Tax=Nocardia terpenica TaxID=455432 RepID=A0A291RGQ6_9NOCA|nr:hypothetical protein [Nocardia terpenica]ATL66272.1 hypothetical protein CRH09_08725 [Nocardia terpenica]